MAHEVESACFTFCEAQLPKKRLKITQNAHKTPRMPELPEIEIIRLFLLPVLVGKTLVHISIRQRKLRTIVDEHALARASGHQIQDIQRLAKYLLLDFPAGHLVFHLGMSGNLYLVDPQKAYERHEHAEFIFDHNLSLRYRDPRRFGRIFWLSKKQLPQFALSLGKEPWDTSLTSETFYQTLQRHDKPIKNVLLAGDVIAGIGNIYANEALAYAHIHPKTSARLLSLAQCDHFLYIIRQVLSDAIAKGGSSIQDYAHPDGQKGYFQNYYIVYRRQGLPCVFCSTPIEKIVLAGRSSFFCPQCQPEICF
jgi:formamidopyrimidine-DNA glycosylase